jgi:hypothetical protein
MFAPKTAMMVRAALAVLVLASVANAELFRRSSDWIPSTHGASSSNPGPSGPPRWTYEWTTGGALNSANPWYRNPTTYMTWDSSWYGQTVGVWSRGDNLNPPVFQNYIIHNQAPSVIAYQPIARWVNLGGASPASLSGSLVVKWTGANGLGRPSDVDVVIAKQDAGRTVTTLLYTATVQKPNPFPSVGDFVTLPVNLGGLNFAPGESMIVTLRAKTTQYAWIQMFDNLNLTVVPAPAGAGLLAMGGVVALRRRRR